MLRRKEVKINLGLIKKFQEWREYEKRADTLESLILEIGIGSSVITKAQALNIAALAGCVDIISNTIAMIPIKLYIENDGKVTPVKKDNRIKLLNDDTKDTLDAFSFKKAFITDYLLEGAGYAYINKSLNTFKSLHYVANINVSPQINFDPIFKDYDILVNGIFYKPFEFLKILNHTIDGATGTGIIAKNNDLLAISYLTMQYEKILQQTGGNKKGFLKSKSKLDDASFTALKAAWNNLYKNNTENMLILNDGVEFQEAQSTSVELQMNESKQTNSAEICKIFNVPKGILDGNATDAEYNNFIKLCIMPIVRLFETALNKDFLLEIEKDKYYFAFDMKQLTKADILKRFQSYEIAIKNGWMQWDEIRFEEDLEPYGLNFIKLGLADVLFDPKTKEIYTPNTNKTNQMNTSSNQDDNKINDMKGGEKIEN